MQWHFQNCFQPQEHLRGVSSRTDRHFRLNPLLSVTAHLRTLHVHTFALPYPSLSLS